MEYTDIRLIGLDLDGTLLDDKKKISEENRKIIRDANKKGIFIVPVTGRSWDALPDCLVELSEIRYVITSNGAAIYDKDLNSCIYNNCMKSNKAIEVMDAVNSCPVVITCFINGSGHMDAKQKHLIERFPYEQEFITNFMRLRVFSDDLRSFISYQSKKVEKINLNYFTANREELDTQRKETLKILDEIENIIVTYSGIENLEITTKSATKGTGIIKLAEILNIPRNAIMAFGDSTNDIDMIKKVGLGVAMENSIEELKKEAKFITKSNNDHGIAYAIRHFIHME